jgi:hypothetical protein
LYVTARLCLDVSVIGTKYFQVRQRRVKITIFLDIIHRSGLMTTPRFGDWSVVSGPEMELAVQIGTNRVGIT